MKVFISWSGPVAHALAIALRDWLPQVVSLAEPWVSSEDISKGKKWSAEIAGELDETSQGVVIVTPDNQREPWLNFEAGAIAKSNGSARTLLFDIPPSGVTGPLAEFQHTIATDEADMFKFVQSVNAATEKPLSEKLLRKMFDRAWPDFFEMHNDFRSKSDADADAKPRSVEDMVAEVLDRLREVESSTHYMSGQLRAALVNYATNARDEYEAFAARQEILDRIGDMVMTDLNCVGIGESGRSGYWIAFDPPLRPGTKARLVNHIAEELGFAANFMLSIRGPQGTPTDRYRIKHGTATRTSVRPDRNR